MVKGKCWKCHKRYRERSIRCPEYPLADEVGGWMDIRDKGVEKGKEDNIDNSVEEARDVEMAVSKTS